MNYSKTTIIQASDHRKGVESLKMKEVVTKIISLDKEIFYPSVKFNIVKKIIHYHAKILNKEGKIKIKTSLEMVKSGVNNIIIKF